MSKYYCLIAGLPPVTLDDTRLTYSVSDFKAELEVVLSKADKQLTRWLFYPYDHANLLLFLRKKPLEQWNTRAVYSEEEIKEVCDLLKDEDRVPAAIPVPAYMVTFIRMYYARFEETDAAPAQLLEDHLATLYYNEAMRCDNEFLANWFEMNLNIGNVMVAANCRKYGLDKETYIIGNNEVAERLRQTGARDFHLGDLLESANELMQIAEEPDFMMREKRLDMQRWKWLDEHTFFKTFDIESVMAYLLRLAMTERWLILDKARGEQTFRKLVSDMKQESTKTLEEFKENNK